MGQLNIVEAIITNKKLLEEILISKEQGYWTIALTEMFTLIVEKRIGICNYRGLVEIEDLRQAILADLLEYWHHFNGRLNPYAFYTGMILKSIRRFGQERQILRQPGFTRISTNLGKY